MHPALMDDWDRHWTDIASTTEAGPTPKYRTRLILKLLELGRFPGQAQLVDLGSGLGDFAAAARANSAGADIVGLELSRTGVEIGSRKVPSARFYQRNLLKPVQPGDTSGICATHAVCSEVLEHLDDPLVFLRNAVQYMGPDCRLIATVPGGPSSAFARHIGHRRHYRPADLRKLLEQAGFIVERVAGYGFPFFNLFRMLATLRGKRLIQDVSVPASEAPLHVRLGCVVFDVLFRLNLSFWGWQTVAVARWPGNPPTESAKKAE